MYNVTHTNRSSKSKKVVSIALCAAMTVSAFAAIGMVSANSVSAADYNLAENIQDGTILHCFDWTYSDIKAELPNIAKAGFTSIQTSPAQPAAGQGPWYWLYQPTSFSVGTELGTKEELKELCEAADQYGIKVIVDVVANHLAGDHTVIQSDLQDEKYWHSLGKITSYSNRKQVTDGELDMPDLKSEDAYVQSVVLNYVNELKEIGVDGIRWDAAKHIALPSEGCDFWKTVTDTGLYNYGEILVSPVDGGGEDLMAEYTNYMSVTDSAYGDTVRKAFDSGKAPNFDGNWTDEGISASKLVYWGESHDTYSNAEGKESNAVSQNVIDRAYAVVAARCDAAALYLSRPEAKARDSIRYGVKGSRQFASDEIAAVNHFHNEMGVRPDAYGVTDNCSVVTRKDGGAVLVLGKGSNQVVTVENVKSYVPEGTYVDDVSGNMFTVTSSTITGMIGDTGIAVLVEEPEARVSSSVVSGTKFDDTLQLRLKALSVTNATYETSEGKSGTFSNDDLMVIGEDTESGNSVTVTLKGTNKYSEEITETYTYIKNESKDYPTLNGGGVVFDNTKTGWDTVNVYVYDEVTTSTTVTNGSWPGVKMEDCGDNLFKYELPEQFASCKHIMVIFNNGNGDQIPGQMQAGLTLTYTEQKLYDGSKWLDLPQNSEPEQSEESEISGEQSETSEEVSNDTSDETSDNESSEDVSQVSFEDNSDGSSENQTTSQVSDTTSTTGTVSTVSTVSTTTSTASTASTSTTSTVSSTSTTTVTEVVSTSDSSFIAVFIIALMGLVSGLVGMKAYQKRKNDK